jgi:rod shape-determining protein MreC
LDFHALHVAPQTSKNMLGTFSRFRPLTLLVGVVLAQVLLLAFQIKRGREVRLIRYWAVELMTPAQRAGTWTLSKLGGVWTGYIALHNARTENEQLRSELDRLQLRSRELESEAAEGQRLGLLLNFRQGHPEASMLAAQVIGASADSSSHTLFINRGDRDQVRRNLGVITPEGVVGKIVEVFPSTAQVQLINDKDSGVGALLADTRTHGVVRGTGDPEPRMDYVVNDEKVHPGELILTSGEDRIFPKGLLIGTAGGASPASPFQLIHVHPAARLDRLEDVLVLLSQQELTPKGSGQSSSVVPASPPPAATVDARAADTSRASASAPGRPPQPNLGKPSANPTRRVNRTQAPAVKPAAPRP